MSQEKQLRVDATADEWYQSLMAGMVGTDHVRMHVVQKRELDNTINVKKEEDLRYKQKYEKTITEYDRNNSSSSTLDDDVVIVEDVKVKLQMASVRRSVQHTRANAIDVDDEADGEAEDGVPMQLLSDRVKALMRFLRIVVGGISGFTLTDLFHSGNFLVFTKSNGEAGFESELHSFVNIINFSMLRVLAQIRAQCAVLRGVTLLQLLLNEQASNHYAALVCDLWKDGQVERGMRYQSLQTIMASDEASNREHMAYFESLQAEPVADLDFPPVELRTIEIEQQSLSSDTDLFVTPFDRPFMFFLRLTLQAMHMHRPDVLKHVFNNVQATRGVGNTRDIDVQALRGAVFDGFAALGYVDALALTASIFGSSATFMEWMRLTPTHIAYAAHLVATCANHRLMLAQKSDSRKAVMDRLDLMKVRIARWIQYVYENQL